MAAKNKKKINRRRKNGKQMNRKQSARRRKNSTARMVIKRLILGAVLIAVTIFGFIAFKYGNRIHSYQQEAKKLVNEGGESVFHANQTSRIYDADGNVITSLIGARDAYYLDFNQIPYFVKAALVTTEDRNFYAHSGVDIKAILRASLALIQNNGKVTQGGSTITQQLARNVFLSHEVSVSRKVKEIFIAREIERKYSKEKILEFYINNIYFGNGYYGIEAASRGYFSKSVTQLSLGEIAYICSIPNNPTMYDPYVNSQATSRRKDRILKQMYEQDDIDKEMYEEALYTTIVLSPSENKTTNSVETYVRNCATLALMEHAGFELKYYFDSDEAKAKYEESFDDLYNEISAKLYTGGYSIYTSIHMDAQSHLQEILDKNLEHYTGVNEEGTYEFQGAVTCIDNATGKVIAIVGSRSQNYKGFPLNRAYQSYRQPGSSIKPILVYTPLLERNFYPESVVEDAPIENGPVNSPNVYEGNISLRYAVEKSKNTIAWKYFTEMSADTCLSYLKNMDFKRIVKEDYVPPVSIGGMTYGVSTVEMASAYATLCNEGVYRSATCITKIVDVKGDIILDNIDYQNSKTSTVHIRQIYDKNASRMMTDMLKGVLTSGTGRKYNISNAICAAKTGTTNENKDVWFVGYSKYYTTAVWCGYDLPKEINDGYGTTCSGNIWNQFMTYLHEGKEQIDFPPYVNEAGRSSNGEPVEEESTEESSEESSKEVPSVGEQSTEPDTNLPTGVSDVQGDSESATQTDVSQQTTREQTTEESSARQQTTRQTSGGGNRSSSSDSVAPGGAGQSYQEYWGE